MTVRRLCVVAGQLCALGLALGAGGVARAEAPRIVVARCATLNDAVLQGFLDEEALAHDREVQVSVDCEGSTTAVVELRAADGTVDFRRVQLDGMPASAHSRLVATVMMEGVRWLTRAATPTPEAPTPEAPTTPPAAPPTRPSDPVDLATGALTRARPPEPVDDEVPPAIEPDAEPSLLVELGAGGHGVGFVQFDTLALGPELSIRIDRVSVVLGAAWASRADPLGTIDMGLFSLGAAVDLLCSGGEAIGVCGAAGPRISYASLSSASEVVGATASSTARFVIEGRALGRVFLRAGAFLATLSLGVGWSEGIVARAEERDLIAAAGLTLDTSVSVGWAL